MGTGALYLRAVLLGAGGSGALYCLYLRAVLSGAGGSGAVYLRANFFGAGGSGALYLRVVLLRSRVRLEHSHDQASDELTRVSTHFSVEVAADSGDCLLLALVVEYALSTLTRGEKPLEQSEPRGENTILTLDEHGDLASWIDSLVLFGHVLLRQSVDQIEFVVNLRVLARHDDSSRV